MTAFQNGVFGFQLIVPSPAAAVFPFRRNALTASSPSPLGATWGVHLAAWQSASAATNRNQLGVLTPGVQAIVTLGGGGQGGSASEVVTLDYPAAGTTFNVHSTSVQVEVACNVDTNLVSDKSPVLSGWLTHRPVKSNWDTQTLTFPVRVVGAFAGFAELVPVRARAYRIMFVSGVRISGSQLSGNATPRTVGVDILFDETALTITPDNQSSNRSRWFPLSPESQSVVVTDASGAGTGIQYAIQWLIELG